MKLEQQKHIARENKIASKLARLWGFDYGSMGPYSPFDVYFLKNKNLKAIVEIRSRRDRELKTFNTVLIDLDKWFSLMQAEIALGIAGLYCIAFTDGIYFVRIGSLPVNKFKITYKGRTDRPEAKNDLSPVIEVSTDYFKYATDSQGVFEN